MLFLLLLRPFIAVATPGLYPDCLDENGNPVDWWFLMKEATGSRYVYLDSMMMANKQLGGSRLSGDIQSPTSPLVRTLAKANPLYHPEYVYRAYNDQPPLDLTASDGHSKTVSVYRNFSAEESFWLRPAREENIEIAEDESKRHEIVELSMVMVWTWTS